MTLRPKSTFRNAPGRQQADSHPSAYAPMGTGDAHAGIRQDPYFLHLNRSDEFRERVFAVVARKWVVLLGIAFGLGIAAAICMYTPARYEAKATLTMLQEPGGIPGSLGQPGTPESKDFNVYVRSRANTLAEIMNSFAVRKVVAIRLTKKNEKASSQPKTSAPAETTASPVSLFPGKVPKV